MCRICFQACFFRFHVILNSLFFGWPVRSAESDFSLSAKRFFIWLGLTEQEARVCTQKRPEFLFFGALIGYGCPVFNFFLCCGFFFFATYLMLVTCLGLQFDNFV